MKVTPEQHNELVRMLKSYGMYLEEHIEDIVTKGQSEQFIIAEAADVEDMIALLGGEQ